MSLLSRLQKEKSLSEISTFGIGGKARLFIEIHTVEEMLAIYQYIRKEDLPFFVVGKGSNSLFDDRGFDGLIISNNINFINLNKGEVFVGAGYSFSLLGVKTARKGWMGLEFASGIPGSVGGAIFMNAGANGMETKDYLTQVGFIDEQGVYVEKNKEELEFSYRNSSFQRMKSIIVSGKFLLEESVDVRQKQISIVNYRIKTQPYKEKSAGCVFRNPKKESAGALIEKCGLKGISIGGAKISTTHANFIINQGNARARDVLDLIDYVKQEIKEKTGEELEIEIRYIPYHI